MAIIALFTLFLSPLATSSATSGLSSYEMSSSAMAPGYELGTVVPIQAPGLFGAGSVVVVDVPQWRAVKAKLLLRVVALEGQTVEFHDNRLFVDGRAVAEPYLVGPPATAVDRGHPIPDCGGARRPMEGCLVPPGHIFVLGDNRGVALDSRLYGPVPTAAVVGVAVDGNS